MTIGSLDKEQQKVAASLTSVEKIVVLRANILRTALQIYQDSNILNKKLGVSFIGEIGEDLDGLTKILERIFDKFYLWYKSKKISKWNQSKPYLKRNGNPWEGSCSMDFYYVHIFLSPLTMPSIIFCLSAMDHQMLFSIHLF